MVWYSHLFQNFPQLIVIHTVKGFGIVNKAEIDVFLELFCFFWEEIPHAPSSRPGVTGGRSYPTHLSPRPRAVAGRSNSTTKAGAVAGRTNPTSKEPWLRGRRKA